ncbi:hypothetical protein [Mycobacterium riyadhense]|nr:hypothetical protein [Mycobacterium riyadhense]
MIDGATTSSQATASTPTSNGAQLQSLIPTPAKSQRTDGPDPIDNGIHLHFVVNGSPSEVMAAYKTALEGKGWSVTVKDSHGGGGGGGATYTGNNAGAYGVFTGGGYGSVTDIDACAWSSQSSSTDCGRHSGR